MMELEREQLALASRRLAREGLVIGTSGNLSARREEAVAITPTGAVLADLEPGAITVIDLDGRVIEGELAPTSELDLHLGVYRRYDAGAVVHTHSPAATALSCVVDEVPCLHYGMLALGGDVRVAPYATFGTPELAAGVLDALEGHTAALMANHGAVTYGVDVAGAMEAALLLEWACDIYTRAVSMGSPRILTDAERGDVVRAAVERGYGSTRAVADGGGRAASDSNEEEG